MRNLTGILLVDDDATSTFLTERLLRRLVPTPHLLVATNGAEGLRLLRDVVLAEPAGAEADPWLVLLDVKMPVLNGFEFLAAYQQLPPTQQQRALVVVLTSSVHTLDLERLQQLPIAGLMAKPLTEAKLLPLLRSHSQQPPFSLPETATSVFQLLYYSQATSSPSEAELYALLSQARQANAARQITGVLVYQHGHYIQVLEGPEAEVRALYARIQQDPRHTRVTTISEVTDCPRYLGHWRMALGQASVPALARLVEAVLSHESGGKPPLASSLLQDVGAALDRTMY
jgi:CheY-like chemotaxis protein